MELFTVKVAEYIGLIWRPKFFILVAILLYNIFLVQVLMYAIFCIENQLFFRLCLCTVSMNTFFILA